MATSGKKGDAPWWAFLAGALIVIVVVIFLLIFFGKIKVVSLNSVNIVGGNLTKMFG